MHLLSVHGATEGDRCRTLPRGITACLSFIVSRLTSRFTSLSLGLTFRFLLLSRKRFSALEAHHNLSFLELMVENKTDTGTYGVFIDYACMMQVDASGQRTESERTSAPSSSSAPPSTS